MWNKKIIKFIGTDNPKVLTRINIYDVLEKKKVQWKLMECLLPLATVQQQRY